MWATLKALPIVPKILLGCLAVGIVSQVAVLARGHGSEFGSRSYSAQTSPASYDEPSNTDGVRNTDGDASQALAQFKAQQSQLMAQVYQCEAQMNEATNRMRDAAIQGQFYNARPQCEQYMPQWTAQEAYLETEIYRIQTGDKRSTVREITGVTGPTGTSGGSSSGDGTDAVDRWNRQANRGNTMYTDESGQQHELPTRAYYFRDRSSGQIIGSDSPNPPNDGRDYEQFTSED
jgi:hypothetical protein